MKRKNRWLHETVTHQKSGIIHLLFFFSFLFIISFQHKQFFLKSSCHFLYFNPSFLEEIFYCQVFFIHCLTSYLSPFKVLNSTGFILCQLKNCLFASCINVDSHLSSLFFIREASGLARTQCLRKGLTAAAYTRLASGW